MPRWGPPLAGAARARRRSRTIQHIRSALWRDSDDRFTVIGFVKNVTDEVGFGSSTASPSGVSAVGARRQVTLIFPRTYGIEFQYRF